MRWPDGGVYDGSWQNDMRHGKGMRRYADGKIFSGEYVQHNPQGHGLETYPDGSQWKGEWVAGAKVIIIFIAQAF